MMSDLELRCDICLCADAKSPVQTTYYGESFSEIIDTIVLLTRILPDKQQEQWRDRLNDHTSVYDSSIAKKSPSLIELLNYKLCSMKDTLDNSISKRFSGEACVINFDASIPVVDASIPQISIDRLCDSCIRLMKKFARQLKIIRTIIKKFFNVVGMRLKPTAQDSFNYSKMNENCTNNNNTVKLITKKVQINQQEHASDNNTDTILNGLEIIKRKRGRPRKCPNRKSLKSSYNKKNSLYISADRSKCPFCSRIYSTKNEYEHKCLAYRNTLYCSDCKIFSTNSTRYEKHLTTYHHKDKKFICKIGDCSAGFVSKSAFMWHTHFHSIENFPTHVLKKLDAKNDVPVGNENNTPEQLNENTISFLQTKNNTSLSADIQNSLPDINCINDASQFKQNEVLIRQPYNNLTRESMNDASYVQQSVTNASSHSLLGDFNLQNTNKVGEYVAISNHDLLPHVDLSNNASANDLCKPSVYYGSEAKITTKDTPADNNALSLIHWYKSDPNTSMLNILSDDILCCSLCLKAFNTIEAYQSHSHCVSEGINSLTQPTIEVKILTSNSDVVRNSSECQKLPCISEDTQSSLLSHFTCLGSIGTSSSQLESPASHNSLPLVSPSTNILSSITPHPSHSKSSTHDRSDDIRTCQFCPEVLPSAALLSDHMHKCHSFPASEDQFFNPSSSIESLPLMKALESSSSTSLTPIEKLMGSLDDIDYF